MEILTETELKAHLIANDESFRTLSARHQEYDQRLLELEAKPHLSGDEQIEEVRLKKLKLQAKDQMTQIMARYRAHSNG
jgi:uncharacterized protein YdcH (DUF465 family)